MVKTPLERIEDLQRGQAAARRAGVRKVAYAGATAVARMYGVEAWYRLTSGLAHGLEWSKVALVLVRQNWEPTPVVRTGRFSASPTTLVAATRESMRAAREAVGALEDYRGTRPPA